MKTQGDVLLKHVAIDHLQNCLPGSKQNVWSMIFITNWIREAKKCLRLLVKDTNSQHQGMRYGTWERKREREKESERERERLRVFSKCQGFLLCWPKYQKIITSNLFSLTWKELSPSFSKTTSSQNKLQSRFLFEKQLFCFKIMKGKPKKVFCSFL